MTTLFLKAFVATVTIESLPSQSLLSSGCTDPVAAMSISMVFCPWDSSAVMPNAELAQLGSKCVKSSKMLIILIRAIFCFNKQIQNNARAEREGTCTVY